MVEFVDAMKEKINAGIRTGLEQAEAGLGRELNDESMWLNLSRSFNKGSLTESIHK